jgi:hypothetical protein
VRTELTGVRGDLDTLQSRYEHALIERETMEERIRDAAPAAARQNPSPPGGGGQSPSR